MRILGIDPGLQTTGFGIIERDGQQLRYVASGTICTTRTEGVALGNLPARLKILYEGISEVVARYEPQVAAVGNRVCEREPAVHPAAGQARGAALTALVTKDLPVAEYTALQMKKAITGHGRAAKSQIQEMVKRMLSLPGLPGTDAADALGLAITHAHAGSILEQAGSRIRRCNAGSTPCSKAGGCIEQVATARARDAQMHTPAQQKTPLARRFLRLHRGPVRFHFVSF